VNRRRFLSVAAGATAVAAVPGALLLGRGGGGASASPPTTPRRATAKVTKRDLAERLDLDGTLGYGATHELSIARPGTITALPEPGAIIDRGGALAEVDGKDVLLLFGTRPLWRTLEDGVGDGPDVEQLEANLIELGHGTAGALGPNQAWTAATSAAVKRWQKARDVEQTGVVAVGDVEFDAGALRVAERTGSIGGHSGGPVLKVSGTEKVVTVKLEAKRASLVAAGQAVLVQLPDSTTTPAKIRSVGTVAAVAQQGSNPTIDVVVTLDDPSAGGSLDQAPVKVKVTTTAATGVLAVPVGALLALSEGGYAVERVAGDGTTSLVAVELGPFADGWVQVKGAINEGDVVVVPK
jgi:peptidoglycan hydrolase-like protein with peptidoglycan-binding domain